MGNKIAQSRFHTGTFGGDEMQTQASRVTKGVNTLEGRVAAIEDELPIEMALDAEFMTTSATAVPTNLRFPVRKGETWRLQYWGYSKCSTTNGTKLGVIVPLGSTVSGALESSTSDTAVTHWTTQDLSVTAGVALSTALHAGASAAYRPDRFCIRIRVYADGECAVAAASATGGDTTSIDALASICATRVSLA